MLAEEKQYGKVAVQAVKLCESNVEFDPVAAWMEAVCAVSDKDSVQAKSCPKSSFLGLCEEGLVKGVPSGCYLQSKHGGANKIYALEAVRLLKNEGKLRCEQPTMLWQKVMACVCGGDKKHNCQMDVVVGLWNAGKILT